MTKDKNIVVDVISLTTIHAITSDVGSCELKQEIDEDSSAYVDEIIRRKKVSFEDEDEPVVKDTYPWQIKTIKYGLGETFFEILMMRYNIPRSIIFHRASLKFQSTTSISTLCSKDIICLRTCSSSAIS